MKVTQAIDTAKVLDIEHNKLVGKVQLTHMTATLEFNECFENIDIQTLEELVDKYAQLIKSHASFLRKAQSDAFKLEVE